MEEWLYTHKAGLTRAAVRQAAKEIGGVSDFDVEYPRVLALIKSDVDLGHRLGVKGTPTFFINGVRIEGGLEPQVLDQAIAHELRVNAARP
jgi:protein-disulfide isomerase